ncbi:MAG: aspartate kinase [Saccharofermentanales bacterium]|jgi:aspartate kinase
MIVCKFGGSSLADARQIRKACEIMLADPERRIMVVSAPGARAEFHRDRKITDWLLDIIRAHAEGRDDAAPRDAIVTRIREIVTDLGLSNDLIEDMERHLDEAIFHLDLQTPATRANVLALGERMSARIVARYLCTLGAPARMVDPRDAGLILESVAGHTEIAPASYDHLAALADACDIVVFPGFYGRTSTGDTIAFSRGGSDITGAVIAAAVDADVYENWTDRDSVYAVHPDLIEDPVALTEMSYREMRELAYIGFSIIHPEALEPVLRKHIPIHIRNTNRPEAAGTRIIPERTHIDRTLTGIAAADNFCTINLRRVLINQEVGILSKILAIFAELGINVQHVPTGIDSVSIVVREDQFPLERELVLRQRLTHELGFEQITIVRQLSIIMLVGEGMRDTVGVLSQATAALAKEQISIEMVLLDYFEISLLFMMRHYEKQRAVSALYRAFFESA